MSIKMIHQLGDIVYHIHLKEQSLNSTNLKTNGILFVHSMREHNIVINLPVNLKLLPENSFVLKLLLK
jgi:hypothetical protein